VADSADQVSEIAPGLFGGPVLQRALHQLHKVATTDLPVVLLGETGTGKEVVARSLHAWSGRKGSWVAVNCASLPEGLAEAELFGYRRGAFTGAESANEGYFRSADGGTLLLDEVSDLAPGVQAKLLRVLEQREVQPLGQTRPVAIDVRIVVAGQQSLYEAVERGKFRPDLLGRLDGLTVQLPALRQRRADIPALFRQLLRQLSTAPDAALTADLVERICIYDWPLNVRELVLVVRRLAALQDGNVLDVGHLPQRIAEVLVRKAPSASASAEPTRSQLSEALRAADGNVTRAANALGVTRQRLYRMMEAHSMALEEFRPAHRGR